MAEKVELTEEQKLANQKANKGCLKFFGYFILFFVAIFVIFAIIEFFKSPEQKAKEERERFVKDSTEKAIEKENARIEEENSKIARANSDKATAISMAEKFVLKSLKAPSTAKFCDISDYSVLNLGTGLWEVSGFVDSQNSFGAMLRTNFTIEIEFDVNTNLWSVKKFSNK